MKRKTLKTYDVTYLVTLPMTYRIKAASPEEAEELAEQHGECLGEGDVVDSWHCDTELV